MTSHRWMYGAVLMVLALPAIAVAQTSSHRDDDGALGEPGVMDCDVLQDEIEAKIRANGVDEFQLDIIDSARVDEDGVREGDPLAGGEVVGSCDGGSRKVIYRRGAQGSGAMSSEDATLPPREASSEPGEGDTRPAEASSP
ncbi:DUF1161 domain-containing protein [Chromohalobacter israelensis]|uniref:DUF1161 domain-containing protein n=1 Tax=Chromohalobacter israelensis TaxID=141390 RepID=UPI000D916B2F|nr:MULTISPECIES: DUF1161 domain-containing protein [Chromohalobacter]MBZ5874755.1 DUF1161 domain-containing protein [Chromohalobacter salexigens]MDF9433560.1 DUF1161 domain-containing protein [Chromohalobacter israelensis]PWW41807.1 uncharacterized protein DUF1161 [Chromohalobacter salexigens]